MNAGFPSFLLPADARRHRGSVLILVVVVLVLVMLIGTAFIQSARHDRYASGQMNRNNIEEVARSALDQVLVLIEQDGRSGDTVLSGGPLDEPYDFPFLASDGHLSPTYPLNLGGTFFWYQVAWTDQVNQQPGSLILVQPQKVSAMGDPGRLEIPAPSQKANADADGDGLTDSVWLKAPISSIRGIDYFYCTRIIDASSMLNINIATSLLDKSGQYNQDTDAPRCWFPSELDLGNFVLSFINQDANAATELARLLEFRFGRDAPDTRVPWFKVADPNNPTNLDPWQRFVWWANAGQMYGNLNKNTDLGGTRSAYSFLQAGDEFELRLRNGLNSPDTKSVIDTMMPYLLRDADPANGDRNSVLPEGSVENFVQDGRWGTGRELDYFQTNPRTMLTTFSGANDLGGRWGGAAGAVYPRRDINRLIQQNPAGLADELNAIYSLGSFQLPDGLKNLTVRQFADRYAACIVDYVDRDLNNINLPDNLITQVNGQYGFEPLPMLTEVYVQQHYTITAAAPGPPPTPPDTRQEWTVEWTADGPTGYAIEVRNPYGYAVSLKHVFLYVDGQKFGELSALAGRDFLKPFQALVLYRNSKGTRGNIESMILDDAQGGQEQPAGLSRPLQVVKKAINLDWPQGGDQKFNGADKDADKVRVELRASTGQPGGAATEMAFGYSRVDSKKLPAKQSGLKYTTNNPSDNPQGRPGYLQYGRIGDARGMNCLTVRAEDFNVRHNSALPTSDGEADAFKTGMEVLGKFDKTSIGKAGELGGDWNRHQFTCASAEQGGRIRWIGELLQVPLLALDAAGQKTIPQIWNEAGAKSHVDFLVDIDPPAGALVGTGDQGVPHFVAMLDRFTTIAPNEDGQDNDGDGGADGNDPEGGEYFIPGKININTVSGDLESVNNGTHLLMRCLPIPDIEVRKQVVRAILQYRDAPLFPGTKVFRENIPCKPRTAKAGIAYIGELLLIPDVRDALGRVQDPNANGGTGGNVLDNGDSFELNNVVVDRTTTLADAPQTVGQVQSDDIVDDREEQLLVFKWLSQLLTTRSDRYVVYITVRGYLSSKGSVGVQGKSSYPGEAMVEQMRLIALVDRSTLTDNNGKGGVRLLGLYKY